MKTAFLVGLALFVCACAGRSAGGAAPGVDGGGPGGSDSGGVYLIGPNGERIYPDAATGASLVDDDDSGAAQEDASTVGDASVALDASAEQADASVPPFTYNDAGQVVFPDAGWNTAPDGTRSYVKAYCTCETADHKCGMLWGLGGGMFECRAQIFMQ
jgi:hypothetical protein